MKTIKLNNKNIVIGLEWDLLDPGIRSETSAVRAILKRNPGVKMGVLVRSADLATIGMVPAKQKKPAGLSGAALLALANQEEQGKATGQSSSIEDNQWIVVERLQDDEFWVVDIKDGVPLPGCDFVGGMERVRVYLDEMIENTSFKIFTTDPDISALVSHRAIVVPKGAPELIEEVEKSSRANIKVWSGVDPRILIAIGVFVFLGAGLFGWQFLSKLQQEKNAQLAAAQRASANAAQLAQDKKDYVQGVQQAVLSALDTGVAGVDAALSSASPRDVVASWIDMVEGLPLNHSGWSTETVSCSMETLEKPVCTVSIKRTPIGINRILLQDYPDAQIVGDEATYLLRGQDMVLRKPDWNELDSAQAFMMGLMSDLQFLRFGGINYTQTESKDIVQAIVLPTPPASLAATVNNAVGNNPAASAPRAAPINTGVAKGQLGFAGEDLWSLRGLLQTLDRSGLSVLSLSVKVSGGKHPWQLQTDYYIRSLPAPVIPVVVGPDGPITTPLPEKYRHLVSQDLSQGSLAPTSGAPLPTDPEVVPADASPEEDAPISIGLPDAPAGPPVGN